MKLLLFCVDLCGAYGLVLGLLQQVLFSAKWATFSKRISYRIFQRMTTDIASQRLQILLSLQG